MQFGVAFFREVEEEAEVEAEAKLEAELEVGAELEVQSPNQRIRTELADG